MHANRSILTSLTGGKVESSLQIAREDHGEWVVFRYSGAIDVGTVPTFRENLHGELASGSNNLILDFGEIEFFDSTGLGVMVGALKRARSSGGDVVIVVLERQTGERFSPRNYVRNTLEVTGLIKVFQIFNTAEEALEVVQASVN